MLLWIGIGLIVLGIIILVIDFKFNVAGEWLAELGFGSLVLGFVIGIIGVGILMFSKLPKPEPQVYYDTHYICEVTVEDETDTYDTKYYRLSKNRTWGKLTRLTIYLDGDVVMKYESDFITLVCEEYEKVEREN